MLRQVTLVAGGVVLISGVQWYSGRWWYYTPQNTWMWYNNGNWVDYRSAQ